MNNQEIRKQLITKRLKLNKLIVYIKSLIIFLYVINNKHYKSNNIIYLYKDFKNELNTNKLITYSLKKNKSVYIPVCVNKKMIFQKINKDTKFVKNNFGILEPIYDENKICNESGFMLIPVVAAYKNYRLGFGHGYYDKFLSKNEMNYTLGVGYNFQKVPFKINKWDVKLDKIKLF